MVSEIISKENDVIKPENWDEISDIPINWSTLKEVETDWSLVSDIEIKNMVLDQKLENENDKRLKIMLAKYFLIKGDLERSYAFAKSIQDLHLNNKITFVQKKILSLIYFIKGDLLKSYELLNHPLYYKLGYYKSVCMLKMASSMAVPFPKSLEYDWELCQNRTEQYSKNFQIWPETMVLLKTKSYKIPEGGNIREAISLMTNSEMTKIWLKMGLYTGKEKELLHMLHHIPEESYRSSQVKDLVALVYYRNQQTDMAWKFINDGISANAQNLKGNLLLNQRKYELAYGHFQLALKRKVNSINALERLIPLSWLLENWEQGLKFTSHLYGTTIKKHYIWALEAAFNIKAGKFDEAKKNLSLLKSYFKNEPPPEVEVLKGFFSLLTFDNDQVESSAAELCKKNDGLSCWMQIQTLNWENIGATLSRSSEIIDENSDSFIEQLKSPKEIISIKEDIDLFNKGEIEAYDDMDRNKIKLKERF